MTLRVLPVFESIVDNGFLECQLDTEEWQHRDFGSGAVEGLHNAKHVLNEYDVPDPGVAESGRDGSYTINLEKSLGHTALPFPMMWVEWKIPGSIASDDPSLRDARVAALCTSARIVHEAGLRARENGQLLDRKSIWQDTIEGTDLDRSWQCIIFMEHKTAVPVALPGVMAVALDHQGMYLGCHARTNRAALANNRNGLDHGVQRAADEDPQQSSAFMVRMAWGAIMAVAWMNCKNVDTDLHTALIQQRVPAKGKRKSRKAYKSIDYHTIRLPGQSGGGAGGTGEHGGVRMHTVRGHFKTFTKERPLLGRATGTYWWGWQVRGNPARGVSVTDYNVKAKR